MALRDDIYSGAATFGKIRAIIGVVIGTILGLIFMLGGVVIIKTKAKLTSKTTGTIKSIKGNCIEHTDKNSSIQYRCVDMTISYDDEKGGNHEIIETSDGNEKYAVGDNVDAWYDPSNPKNGNLYSDNNHTIGWVAVVAGVIMLFGSWFWLWMAMKYKFVAASGGAQGVVEMMRL
jgi:hypothetical protein